MGFRLSAIPLTKQFLHRTQSVANQTGVPKGYLAIYVGENEKKRFVIPVSWLNQPSFQDLLRKSEEEFGYHHPMGGITIPCREEIFKNIISCIN